MNRMSARTIAALHDAVEDQTVIGRYLAFVSTIVTERGCRLWTGAVSSKGHGRLWLASYPVELAGHTVVRDVCVIAHRYGYALEYGFGALLRAEKVTHRCDEPLCQEPTHWRPGTSSTNLQEFHDRKLTPGSPLRDIRGARGRAVALRNGLRAGTSLTTVITAGQPSGDLLQDPLPLDGMEWLPRFVGGCGPGPRQRTVRGLLGRGCLPGLSDMCGEAPVFIERTSVGLDVHARSVVAHAIDGVTGEVFMARLVPGVEPVAAWLAALPGPVAVLYEAGPTGFGLARGLRAAGLRCEVAAPSKLQRPSGDRVKTDARDAEHLCRLLRLDEFTAVAVPEAATEAARDLVRAREDCRTDLMRARNRTSKLLLRHGIVYSGGTAWTNLHLAWLSRQRLEEASSQWALEESLDQVLNMVARRDRLDARIGELAADSAWTPVARRLGCLRGISTLTGFALAVEIGDWSRFDGNSIGAYVGLIPSEHSSGTSRALGPITKTGNKHVRRLLVEAAWHHAPAYRPGKTMRDRWDLASPAARARGDAGNRRLHTRWVRFQTRKKQTGIANAAIARELAGWCWSLAMLGD